MSDKNDLVIVGNGITGLALAVSVASHVDRKRVVIVGQHPVPAIPTAVNAPWSARIYAISPASEIYLRELGVWPLLPKDRLTPVRTMEISGHRFGHLKFSAYQEGVEALAWVIESDALCGALAQIVARHLHLQHMQVTPTALSFVPEAAKLTFSNGESLAASLLVAADGARSWVREQAGVGFAWLHHYQQLALVANFRCELAHENCASQWFLTDSILAWLPLGDNNISVIWAMPIHQAQGVAKLPVAELEQKVAAAGHHRFGRFQLLAPPQLFPLTASRTNRSHPRLVFLGDAAHTLHPLTGHGANLGLGDAKSLGTILQSTLTGVDFADEWLLRKYERSRAKSLCAIQSFTHGTKWLYEGRGRRVLGDIGLTIAQRLPLLRSALARYAMDKA